jgi:hypothetical protein
MILSLARLLTWKTCSHEIFLTLYFHLDLSACCLRAGFLTKICQAILCAIQNRCSMIIDLIDFTTLTGDLHKLEVPNYVISETAHSIALKCKCSLTH